MRVGALASLVVGTWAALFHSGCACDGDAIAMDLAGDDARRCGRVSAGADPTAVDACVVDAFAAGEPFVARYDLMGIDSQVARVLAFRDGTLWDLLYDSSPCGGDSCGATVTGSECPMPMQVEVDGRPAFQCAVDVGSETFCD